MSTAAEELERRARQLATDVNTVYDDEPEGTVDKELLAKALAHIV